MLTGTYSFYQNQLRPCNIRKPNMAAPEAFAASQDVTVRCRAVRQAPMGRQGNRDDVSHVCVSTACQPSKCRSSAIWDSPVRMHLTLFRVNECPSVCSGMQACSTAGFSVKPGAEVICGC